MNYPFENVSESIINSDFRKIDRLKKFIDEYDCKINIEKFMRCLYVSHCRIHYSKSRKLGRILEFPTYSPRFDSFLIDLYDTELRYFFEY